MINITTASAWLNWEQKSALTSEADSFLKSIEAPPPKSEGRKKLLQDIHKNVRQAASMLEKAEILVLCGAQAYELDEVDDAARWLDNAAQFYEYCNDTHRYAVALWMLFIVRRAQGQYRIAFGCARQARKLLMEKADELVQQKLFQAESWYRGRIIEMTCDIVSSPENMFELLPEFSGSKLSPSALDIRNRISTHLERKQTEKIDRDQQLLLGITLHSKNPTETAEAFGFCGVVAWVQEDKNEAVNFFRSAMALYLPSSYEYAVLQWMCGLVLLNNPIDYGLAIQMMEGSIQGFDQLRTKAIHDNKFDRRDWFALHHLAMKRVLRTLVEAI